MVNKYGGNAALSYNQYLRVPELIALQTCRSNPIHHDELLFITIHQSFELWFKQILHELDASFGEMNKNRAAAAARALRRVVEIQKLLVNQIHILATMAPANFLGFRDELNPASGFQSMQFREIEFASGLKDTAILENFHHDEFTLKRLQARFDSPSLGEAFFGLLRQRGCDAPADNAHCRQRSASTSTGKEHTQWLKCLPISSGSTKSSNLPKPCSNTTSIFPSGGRTT